MALFIPCAGFSPNCMDVFVQTAHWAPAVVAKTAIKRTANNMLKKYFISACKVKAGMAVRIKCLTENKELNC